MEEASDEYYRACAMAAVQMYGSVEGQFAVEPEGAAKFQATFPLAMYALNQVHAARGSRTSTAPT